MVTIEYKRARTKGLRKRYVSHEYAHPTNAKNKASSQGLPFGNKEAFSKALNRMQSDMQSIGFIAKSDSK